MAKLTTIPISSGYASTAALNDNFDLIETALENTLSRDGTTPNQMTADLDMNGKQILNLPAPTALTDPLRLGDVTGLSVNIVSSWQGDWSGATTYTENQAVKYAGSGYISLQDNNLNHLPTDAAWWGKMVDKGDTGATGAAGAAGAGYTASSTTSATIATGAQSLTTQAGLAYTVGARVRVTNTADTAKWMEGLVTSYSGTTLAFTSDLINGTGTLASWNINLSGERGATGPAGAGSGDMLKSENLSGLANYATARTNMGLAIGTDVQAYDAGLSSIAAFPTAADKLTYSTAADVWAETPVTAYARSFLDDTTASAARATLGATATGDALITAATAAAARTTLGVVIGTDVQAQDATLQSLSALGTAADKVVYSTGVDTWAETPLTAAARTVLDDTTVAAMRATLSAAALGANTDITSLAGLTTVLSVAQGGTGNSTLKDFMVLSGAGGSSTNTAGCGGPTKVETTTNKINYYCLEFDTTTEENAFWLVKMPDNYDGGTITARFDWTNAAGAATQGVVWGIKARAFTDDDALDQAWGTEVSVTDTWLAQNDLHVSADSSAITIAGTPAGGKLVAFNVARKATSGSDTMTGDARLIQVYIEYGVSTVSA